MRKNLRYEVHGHGSDKQVTTLAEARKIAKRRASVNDSDTFVLIYKFTIPGNPYSKTVLVEKWKVNAYGDLVQKKV